VRLTVEQRPQTAAALVGARGDALIAAVFALATIATRFPFRSHRVFNWDAVNFVLAMRDYDVRLHHPHPPGYPVFVGLGRVVQLVVPGANAALVTVAMLLSAGAVAALYWLSRELFGRAAGIVAALYLLVSVTFWTNGAVALAYPSLACFGTLVALFAWRCNRESRSAGRMRSPRSRGNLTPPPPLLVLSAAYAIGGGFRPDLLLFLLPLWIFGHWRQPLTRILMSGALVVVIVLAWFVPTVALSGGWTGYWHVFRAYTSDDVLKRYSVAENGPRALLVNIRDTTKYTGYALYALGLPVAGAAVWLLAHWRRWRNPLVLLFALWMTPMLLFYTWLHIGDPGYVFTFVPAVLLIAARFTVEIPQLLRRFGARTGGIQRAAPAIMAALVAFVMLANTAVFLFRPLALTAHGIRQQDRTIDGKIGFVRNHDHGDPATTLLIAYESYRHWLLYLPEYRVHFVDVTYGTDADRTVAIPPDVKRVVLMDATLLRSLTNAQPEAVTPIEADRVAVVTPTPNEPLRFAPVSSPLLVRGAILESPFLTPR